MTPLARFRMCVGQALNCLDAAGSITHSDYTLHVVDDHLLHSIDKIISLTESLLSDTDHRLDELQEDLV